jgi:cation transport regulator
MKGDHMMSNGPYETIANLPDTIKDILPEEAQRIYLETYQRSWETYEEGQGGEMGQEAVAHRDGWNAVKRDYVKDEKSAQWYKKGEKPEEEEEADSGLVDTIKSAFVKE